MAISGGNWRSDPHWVAEWCSTAYRGDTVEFSLGQRWRLTICVMLVPVMVSIVSPWLSGRMSWWAQCHASPGFYIAILGFWAFAMPFVKKDPSKAERAVWVIVGALLLVFE